MDTLTLAIILALAMLAVTGLWYGVRFLQLDNALLGWEWIILGISSTNAIVYFLTSSEASYHFMVFLDAFSRTVGIPIIGAVGVFMLTRSWKVPNSIKIALFAAGAVLAGIIVVSKAVEAYMPLMATVLGFVFIIAQADLARALFRNDFVGHGIGIVLGIAAIQFTVFLDGVLKAPKSPASFFDIISNFWVYSNVIWSIAFAQISTVSSPASCSLIIPIICASVKRLFLMRLLDRRGRLQIRLRELSGGRSAGLQRDGD